jgi:hypothetical protein
MSEPSNLPAPDSAGSEEVHHRFLAVAAEVPHHLLVAARAKLKATYGRLEHRYGRGYARAIVGAGLAGLPIPVPFSTAMTAAPVIAAAELHRALGQAGGVEGVAHNVVLTVEEIHALGKHFVQELLHGFGESMPSPDASGPVV